VSAAETITRVRGDDWSIPGTLTSGGVAVDLTGATVTAQLRSRVEKSTVAATFTVTVTDAAAGELTLSLADTVTDDLAPGRYVYDVQVVLAGSTQTYGNVSTLIVAGDVTR
jgi:hypothetical protein